MMRKDQKPFEVVAVTVVPGGVDVRVRLADGVTAGGAKVIIEEAIRESLDRYMRETEQAALRGDGTEGAKGIRSIGGGR